ncbi:MAG: hypothetical protein V3T79_04245 [Candidatus Scalindua sediminis]
MTKGILPGELLTFAVENISELFGYIATGRVNIRICRDIEDLPPIASLRKLGMGAGRNEYNVLFFRIKGI